MRVNLPFGTPAPANPLFAQQAGKTLKLIDLG